MARPDSFVTGLGADEAHLRLIATADLHMTLAPFDYHADAPGGPPGLAGTAALAAELRAAAPASLLLDCGDFLQGGPMADLYGLDGTAPAGADGLHPMIAAMNAAGYDAVTVGNHEFDYGLPFLRDALAGARFDVVATNLSRRLGPTPLRDVPLFAPRLIRDIPLRLGDGTAAPLRLGLVGLCPPQVLAWADARLGAPLAARDMVEAARAHAAALRATGADLVVALVHAGIGEAGHGAATEHAALALALGADLDVLLLGHAHRVFPEAAGAPVAAPPTGAGAPAVDARTGRLGGRPAVMPGAHGTHLGVVDLILGRPRDGVWEERRTDVRVLPVPPPPSDSPVRRAIRAPHAATRARLARPVGRTALRLHTHFALVAESAALRLLAEAQRRWARVALADRPEAGLPILCAVTPFRSGGPAGPRNFTDIPPGPLCLRDIYNLCQYPNMLRVLQLNGAEVGAWLERTAGLYARLGPDRPDTPLLAPGAAAYNCDILDGVGYEIDLGLPARHAADGQSPRPPAPGRVRALTIDGRRLRPDARVLLVTHDFRTAGGGRFPGRHPENLVLASRQTLRDALAAYLEATGTVALTPRPPAWRLTAPAGSTALFDTAPAAADHLADLADLRPESLGRTPEGFLRLRLHFG